MKHEKETIEILGNDFVVLHCLGNGQCKCKSCEAKGKYNISWTVWFYRIDMDHDVMCYDCLKEAIIAEIHKMAQTALGEQVTLDTTKFAIENGFFDNFIALYNAGYRMQDMDNLED